jgi:hypothetical protein
MARNVQCLGRAYCVHSDDLEFGLALAGAGQAIVDLISGDPHEHV